MNIDSKILKAAETDDSTLALRVCHEIVAEWIHYDSPDELVGTGRGDYGRS